MVAHERRRAPDPTKWQSGVGHDGATGIGPKLGTRSQVRDRLRFMASMAFGWPWLDPFVFWALRRWYFPLSRLWAAAEDAQRTSDAFVASLPGSLPPNRLGDIQNVLQRFEQYRA